MKILVIALTATALVTAFAGTSQSLDHKHINQRIQVANRRAHFYRVIAGQEQASQSSVDNTPAVQPSSGYTLTPFGWPGLSYGLLAILLVVIYFWAPYLYRWRKDKHMERRVRRRFGSCMEEVDAIDNWLAKPASIITSAHQSRPSNANVITSYPN